MLCHKSSCFFFLRLGLSSASFVNGSNWRSGTPTGRGDKTWVEKQENLWNIFWWHKLWRTLPDFFHVLLTNLQFCLNKKNDVVLFFFAAQDVNISRGNKYLEATFGAWELQRLMPFPLGAASLSRRPTGRSVKDWWCADCARKRLFLESWWPQAVTNLSIAEVDVGVS